VSKFQGSSGEPTGTHTGFEVVTVVVVVVVVFSSSGYEELCLQGYNAM
jgi:hypothetical protein